MNKYLVLEKALSLVNKFRAVMGHDSLTSLPKGKINDAWSCPLRNAIPYCKDIDTGNLELQSLSIDIEKELLKLVGEDLNLEYDSYRTFPLILNTPKPFELFIDLFDDGEYPELVEE